MSDIPHVSTRSQRSNVRHLIFGVFFFFLTSPEAPKFVKIEHKHRALYTKTYVGFTVAGDMHLPYKHYRAILFTLSYTVSFLHVAQGHTDGIVAFPDNNGYPKAPQNYVICTSPILFRYWNRNSLHNDQPFRIPACKKLFPLLDDNP